MSEALRKNIVTYAQAQNGKKVGSGECFDLADQALRDAGAKSAADFGKVTQDADYVWGDPVTIDKTLAGDIIQFRNYASDVTHEKEISLAFPGGEQLTYYQMQPDANQIGYKHHTSVASTAINQGALTVLEQNVDRTGNGVKERIVRSRQLYLKSRPAKSTKSTARVTINRSWGDSIKKDMTNPADKKSIDALVSKYQGKVLTANVTTTFKVTVSGTIWVYRAQKQ
jgi:gamma-glutamylcyclotransferase (GGCT)/AIG2-like uncharacterized protein YtfP